MAFVVAPPLLLPQVPVSSFSFSSQETFPYLSRSSSSSKDSDDDDTKKSNKPYADLEFMEVSRIFEGQDFLEGAVNTFGASVSSCTVSVKSLSKLLPEDTSTTDGTSTVTGNEKSRFFSLRFLDKLRQPKGESFLPQTIYVRDCMKFKFELSEKDDREPMYGKHILIGSPGVGKSVLFFLMALSKARSTPIVYFRKTKENAFCSVFFMNANKNGQVCIVFSRSLDAEKTTTRTISEFLDTQKVQRSSYYRFLDGPKHDDKEETINVYFYDYFCTSGGYPVPKDEARSNTFIWILDAWTEVIDALTQTSAQELLPSASQQGSSELYASAVGPIDKKHATELYSLCGGGIRRIIDAIKNRKKIESWLEIVASTQNKETIELALTSTMRGDSNSDSIRSMFRSQSGCNDLMIAIQIVDSRYALELLRGSLDVKRLFEAFRFAKSLVENSIEGKYFELCCSAPNTSTREQGFPLRGYVQGTGAASVRQLTDAECYWVPSVSNFADIDAAFVHKKTFYALQYTIAKTHPFDCTRFGENVLAVVYQNELLFTKVCIAFVVPESNKNFICSVEPGEISFSTKDSSGKPKKKPCCCSLVVETWRVDTTNEEQLSKSLNTFLSMSLGEVQR